MHEVDAHKIVGYTLSHAGDGNVHLVVAGKKGDNKEWAKIDRVVNTVVTRALESRGYGHRRARCGDRKKEIYGHRARIQSAMDATLEITCLIPTVSLIPAKIFPE